MKKRLSLLLLICCCITVHAQQVPHPYARKIAAILKKLPAKNKLQQDSCMMQITALGQAGVTEMALMLKAPSTGDNTALQYALGSYAAYVTEAGRETARKMAVKAYCTALRLSVYTENKVFLMMQLQLFADNSAVPVLKQYLLHEQLCDPAARVLSQVNSPDAMVALVVALEKAKGKCAISLVTAVGAVHYLSGLDAVTACTASADPALRRAAFFALANIADEDSEPVLAAAAEKAGYKYDFTGATAAYLLFAANLGKNWPTAPALTIADKLLQHCKGDSLVHVRVAALKIIADIRGEDAVSVLMGAVDSNHPVYRAAALEMAGKHMNAVNTDAWIRKAQQSTGSTKAAIITLLGKSYQRAAIPLLTKALEDESAEVRMSAVKAAGYLQSIELLPPLIAAMRTADSTTLKAIGAVLLNIRSRDVVNRVAVAMLKEPPFVQVMLLQVLVTRRADDRISFIRMLLDSPEPAVVQAARAALESMGQ
jgi:HEAT repeat protein